MKKSFLKTMLRYDLCEISKGNYLKVLKCHSESGVKSPASTERKTLYVIIPGTFSKGFRSNFPKIIPEN